MNDSSVSEPVPVDPPTPVVESPPKSSRPVSSDSDDPRAQLLGIAQQLRTRMDRKLLVDFLRLRVATRGLNS